MMLTDDQIKLIYGWYCAAMRREGYKINPPKDTDFNKTYQYRALSTFSKRMEEEAFSEQTIKAIINAAVKYGKKNKLLANKRINILNMKAIIDICLRDIKDRDNSINEILQSVRNSRQYLVKCGYKKASDLIKPMALGGTPRLLYFINSGEVSTIFLAVSRTAAAAMVKLDKTKLPSEDELMKIRVKLLLNSSVREELQRILGTDLNTSGLPGSIA